MPNARQVAPQVLCEGEEGQRFEVLEMVGILWFEEDLSADGIQGEKCGVIFSFFLLN